MTRLPAILTGLALALAAGGLKFTGYTTVPMCTPARAAMLTGKNPHAVGCGWLTHANPGYPGYQAGEMSKDAPTLPELLRAEGVQIAFTPTAAQMHPDGPRTTVLPGPIGDELEGASRPGHFAGMLTVVAKLLGIVAPERAFFGEKDYQQLVLIRQMVADLNIDVTVVGAPIVREADGLALSSRNRYLDPVAREQATACLLYTSPSPRDRTRSRMPSSA